MQHSHGGDPEHDTNPGCRSRPVARRSPCTSGNRSGQLSFGSDEGTFAELIAGHPQRDHVRHRAHTRAPTALPCGCPRSRGTRETEETLSGPTSSRKSTPRSRGRLAAAAPADRGHGQPRRHLSIFGTVLDQASPATAPVAGTPRASSDDSSPRSAGPSASTTSRAARPDGEGDPQLDQNVEMLVRRSTQGQYQDDEARRPRPGQDRTTLTFSWRWRAWALPATAVRVRDHLPSNLGLVSVTATRVLLGVRGHRDLRLEGDPAVGQNPRVMITARCRAAPRITNSATVEFDLRRPWPPVTTRTP